MAAARSFRHDLFSAGEIAAAARVPAADVEELVRSGRVVAFRQFVAPAEAIRLVRRLSNGRTASDDRAPLTLPSVRKRRTTLSLVVSGVLHAVGLILIGLAAAYGLLTAHDTEEPIADLKPVRLVFLMTPGPGGGGGGGGMLAPEPPPVAKQAAPVPKKISSPVPRVVKRAPPPPPRRPTPPVPLNQVTLMPIDVPRPIAPPPPAVQAPVVPVAADRTDSPGLLASASTAPSAGPGTGGGVGTSAGTGLGSGTGAGIGPGSGGGTGGGPYRPGSGVEAPTLVHEVRPIYTEEGRRRSVEGAVSLEIVVTRDGRVGDVRVVRGLGAGLEQKAVEAVRQWRFNPARLHGAAVDVLVTVAVEFSLR